MVSVMVMVTMVVVGWLWWWTKEHRTTYNV